MQHCFERRSCSHTPISIQASELLRDMTLGANMRVHLVRMIILSEPEVGCLLLGLNVQFSIKFTNYPT